MRWLIALALLFQDTKAGEKMTVTVESTLELDTVVRDGKGETTRHLNLVRKEKFTQTRMDAKTVKIECLSSMLQKSGTDTPIEEKPTSLAGQAFFSTRAENGWTVKDVDGGSPTNEGQNLGAWNDVGLLLPAGGAEPKAGDKWNVEGKDLLPLIFPTSIREAAGKFECTCEAVEGGKASILFTGQLSGKGKDEMQTAVILTVKTGRLSYDLGKKRPSTLMLSGSFESTSDIVDEIRKPGTGSLVNNEVDRRKVGEIAVKSTKLEAVLSFE